MKRLISLVIVITIIMIITATYSKFTAKKILDLIKINETEIYVSVVRTPKEIEKGLGRKSLLGEKEGMLFKMPSYDRYTFWMKDMKFPLDIIWISKDIVVDITKNIPVEEDNNLTIYRPTESVNLVLEVNAGFSDKYKIKVGDKIVRLDKFL